MNLLYQSVLVLLCHSLRIAQSGKSFCNPDNSGGSEDCSKDCSERLERVPGEPAYWFNCSIGRKADVDRYKEFHPDAFQEDFPKSFDAPKLLAVTAAYKTDNKRNRYLSIDFQLSKGVKLLTGTSDLPKAVLLEFTSVPDLEVQDTFYFKCPRERLFSFHDYTTKYSAYDALHPRVLTYSCLVGLDDRIQKDKSRRVYLITLTSAFGRSVQYTVTTDVHSRQNKNIWIPVIATHLNETQGTMYVVFERAPDHMLVENYFVKLYSLVDGKEVLLKEVKQDKTAASSEFHNLNHGKYFVKVHTTGCNSCFDAKSYVVDATSLPISDDSPIHYIDDGPKMYILVFGIVLSVLTIVSGVLVWKLKEKCKQKRGETVPARWGWIIHPYEACSPKEGCVVRLANYLEEVCHCKLHPLTIPDSADSVHQYCKKVLQDSSFLLVVDDTDKEPSLECTADDFFDFTITEAIKIKEENNSLHVIPIKFFHSLANSHKLLKDLKLYFLMEEIEDLYCTIQGNPIQGKDALCFLKRGPAFEILQKTIADCQRQVTKSHLKLIRSTVEPKTKDEALEILRKINAQSGARPKATSVNSSPCVESPVSSIQVCTQFDQGTSAECHPSFGKCSGHPHEQQHQHHQNHPGLHKSNQNMGTENFQQQVSFPMDQLDTRVRNFHAGGGRPESSMDCFLDSKHHHIDQGESGPSSKQGHGMEAQFGSPYDSGSYHSPGYIAVSNREPFLSYPSQQGFHRSDQRRWFNHSMSAPNTVMDGVPYEYIHGEVPYTAINGAGYDRLKNEAQYTVKNDYESLENDPLLGECSFIPPGTGNRDRQVLFTTDCEDKVDWHQSPMEVMATEDEAFIPPEDDMDENIYSSQELLDRLESFNSKKW